VASPYRPAAGALTPEIVPESDLAAANGLFSSLESLTIVLGPALGGLLLLADEPAAAVQLNALSFLVAALFVSRLDVRSRGDAEQGESVMTAFVNGLSALRAERVATVLVLFCALDSAVYGASTVLYVPISQQLGTGNDGYGYLLAGSALGGVIAAGLANRLSASSRLGPIILAGIALQAVPFALTIWVHAPPVGFVLQVIAGVGMILVDVLAITALQRDMPRGVLGRVLSLLDVAVLGAILLSSFLFAFVFAALDLHKTLLVIGIGFPAAALLGIRPLLRADRQSVQALRALEPRIALLQVLDLFSAAARPVIEGLARAIDEVEMPADCIVIREGDPPDALWIIVDGEVEVTIGGDFVRTMGPRSYFGEIGLLREIPRTATIRTVEPCVLWKLSGEDFLDALQMSTPSASLLDVSTRRLARTHPQLVADVVATSPPGSPPGPAPASGPPATE
jgi:predicted MFS family arabinose efflux permease